MTGSNEILRSAYLEGIDKNITVRYLTKERDFDVLHDWMKRPYISKFWKMDISTEDFDRYLARTMSMPDREHFMFELDGEPFSFLLTYKVNNEILKDFYEDFEEEDIGVHIVIGERKYIDEKYTVPYFKFGLGFVFDRYRDTNKIIGEPDERNKIIIPSANAAGFRKGDILSLPHKKAQLLVAKRSDF
ncbi:acetyltransferase [Hazenella sp. IB182353]|uniref:GNAT family N-acetyltransferase n=1 Tax=Polycladospora coralii TaxID=2771432 RepID=UPI0017474825|nr:GNAT family N-acetyltransferase [Polycladospora coralii]MBS7530542.1 acetyltransferase [Polycladospora coralii]